MSAQRNTLYIGTNFGHSSSSCLINQNGEIIFAVEEDKLIKEKDTSKFPSEGIRLIKNYITKNEKIVWNEGWNPLTRLFFKGIFHSLKYFDDINYVKVRMNKEINRIIDSIIEYPKLGKFNFVGHHLSHAYSLVPYGLKYNSIIIVSDTIGEYESISIYYWNGEMRLIKKIYHPHSIGSIYHQFAYFLGFKGRTGPGKLMALSGYGKPKWLDDLNKISFIANGNFVIKQKIYPSYRLKDAPDKFIEGLPDGIFKKELIESKNNYNKGINIAASIQEWFTLITWELILQNINIARNKLKLKIDHLGLVGGAALNCQANGFFLKNIRSIDLDSITISPWSDDSGTAIGAAVEGLLKDNPNVEIQKAKPFLGPTLTTSRNLRKPMKDAISLATDALLQGRLIALLSGQLEFGPRALGGRCILGDAFSLDSKKKLNLCKNRPEFMPFAPAVLEEDFNLLFEGIGSENMAWTVKAKKIAKAIIPNAIHVTEEARVQVVKPHDGCLLYNILRIIKIRKGYGIALLTSLNSSGQTIPVYYKEALEMSKNLHLYGIISDLGWEKL